MRTSILIGVAILGAVTGLSCSNSCKTFCQHLYGDCHYQSTNQTVASCATRCDGPPASGCANETAYYDCVSAASCADILDGGLTPQVTCLCKCSGSCP